MARIRMGIIGLGGISNMHINGILRSPDAELAAVCDSNETLLHQVGDKHGIPQERRFTDYVELLTSDVCDAVSICTPNFLHFPVAMETARHGKPFCIEKPVGLNVAEAEQLLELCRKNEVRNMVSFSYRYKPAARYTKWLIEQGHLGKIYHIYGQYLQDWATPETPMSWRFSKPLAGSGALGDLGCHIIDLTRFLVGDTKKVIASADTIVGDRRNPVTNEIEKVDVDDYCHYLAQIELGISGVFSISRFAYGRGNYQRVEVYGDKGALVYSLERSDSLEVCIGSVYRQGHQFEQVEVPDWFKKDQMQSFFDIVNGCDDGVSATMEDGYINQKTVDAILTSFEQERWVRV